MTADEQRRLAAELMAEFAARTGLEPEQATPRRYLWTDAFAVCNYLGLHRERGEPRYRELALRLVRQVHRTLGRHRPDDPRRGWISGLDEETGERHPTRGGLRIGKELPERGEREPYDERLEWDRDGQYFHYLTQWMHALHRTGEETGDVTFDRWARELAVAAHAGFTKPLPQGAGWRMAWKMSIDLSRPLVPTMGHHDPLDAVVSYLALERLDSGGDAAGAGPSLAREIASAAQMCAGRGWVTDDPLGIGGLLRDTARLAEIVRDGGDRHRPLLRRLYADCADSLEAFTPAFSSTLPAAHRLAFRELGLAIGLRAVARVRDRVVGGDLAAAAGAVERFLPLADAIEAFWAEPANRRQRSWRDHVDINTVMLATSLAPLGYLGPPPSSAAPAPRPARPE